jgi:hypothetical protein
MGLDEREAPATKRHGMQTMKKLVSFHGVPWPSFSHHALACRTSAWQPCTGIGARSALEID